MHLDTRLLPSFFASNTTGPFPDTQDEETVLSAAPEQAAGPAAGSLDLVELSPQAQALLGVTEAAAGARQEEHQDPVAKRPALVQSARDVRAAPADPEETDGSAAHQGGPAVEGGRYHLLRVRA